MSKYFNKFYGITLTQEYIWIFFQLKIKITFPRTTGRQNKYKIQNFKKIFFFDGPVQKVKGINEASFHGINKDIIHFACSPMVL